VFCSNRIVRSSAFRAAHSAQDSAAFVQQFVICEQFTIEFALHFEPDFSARPAGSARVFLQAFALKRKSALATARWLSNEDVRYRMIQQADAARDLIRVFALKHRGESSMPKGFRIYGRAPRRFAWRRPLSRILWRARARIFRQNANTVLQVAAGLLQCPVQFGTSDEIF
jgi:hypothetical protein